MAGESITYSRVDKDTFYDAIRSIEYREDDIKEARLFGCPELIHCYDKAFHHHARYFIVYEDLRPVVTVMLARNGDIVFFISKDVNNKIGLIKTLKKFSKETVKAAGPIYTKTAYWYKEAQKMNKVIGFIPLRLTDDYGIYVLEEE